MLRWTSSYQDEHKIAGFPDFVHAFVGEPIVVTLNDGRRLAGAFYSSSSGNNAGEGGWAYYGGFALETDVGTFEIDYLDVADAAIRANVN